MGTLRSRAASLRSKVKPAGVCPGRTGLNRALSRADPLPATPWIPGG